jgi:sugar lactone lactonase YvrE
MKARKLTMKTPMPIAAALLAVLSLAFAACAPVLPVGTGPGAADEDAAAAEVATVTFAFARPAAAAAASRSILDVRSIGLVARRDGDAYPRVFSIDFDPASGVFRSRPLSFPAGSWTFAAKAYGDGGIELYSGQASAVLAAGGSAVVAITLFQSDASAAETYALDLAFGTVPAAGEFVRPDNVAFGPDGRIYVSDADAHWIQIVDPSSRTTAGSIGASDAWTFNTARQIALSSGGVLLAADPPSDRIVRADPAPGGGWTIQNIGSPGDGDFAFRNPSGVAVAPDGRVFIADSANGKVKVYGAGGAPAGSWTAATLNGTPGPRPSSLALWEDRANPADPVLYVFVADEGARIVAKYGADGTFLAASPASGDGAIGYGLQAIAADPAGRIYAADARWNGDVAPGGAIHVYGADLAWIGDYADAGPGDGQTDQACGLAVSADGARLAVADTANHRLAVFTLGEPDAAGLPALSFEFALGAAPAAADWFCQPLDADFGSGGELYILDRIGHQVVKLDAAGALAARWGGRDPGGIGYAVNLQTAIVGGREVVAVQDGQVRLYGTDGAILGGIEAGVYANHAPGVGYFSESFLVDAAGDFLIGCHAAQGIAKLSSGLGAVDWQAPVLPGAATLAWQKLCLTDLTAKSIQDTALTPDGRILLLDSINRRIYVLGADGVQGDAQGLDGDARTMLQEPRRLDVDAAGNIYVADAGAGKVLVFAADGAFVAAFAAGQVGYDTTALTVSPDGGTVVLVRDGPPAVRRFVRKP